MSKEKNSLYGLTDEEKAQLASIETIELGEKGQKVLRGFSFTVVTLIKGMFILMLIITLFILSNRSNNHKSTNKIDREPSLKEKEALKYEQEQVKKLEQLIKDAKKKE